jgi:peptidoglycan hydrolase-like protein with peptidoglycan-binding domain
MWSKLTTVAAAAALTLLVLAPVASAASNPDVAALQVALRGVHTYSGGIDGVAGPQTKAAVMRFQRARRLPADGVAGPRTRRALGRRGAPALGSRVISPGDRGWDVAALQFMLSRRGYSPGSVDGGFGAGTLAALRRFQAAAGIGVDGRAGGGTIRALSGQSSGSGSTSGGGGGSATGPIRLLRPVSGPMGDGFGYPGGRRHDGVDFPEPYGTPVGAAGRGTVVFAGWNSGGYGNLVVVQHRLGYQTWYAHLSAIAVSNGQAVAGGVMIGRIGSTGRSTGPHLHFELRHNGVPINPVPYLMPSSSLGKRMAPVGPAAAGSDHTRCMDGPTPGMKAPPRRQDPRTAVLASC